MQSTPSPSSRRRRWLGVAGVIVAATALAPVVIGRIGPDVAGAAPLAATPTSTAATATATATAAAAPDTTTTGAPLETTTTATTAPAVTTTTDTPAAASTSATTPTTGAGVAVRTAASVPASQLAEVEAIAGGSGFDWRAAGVVIHIGFNPSDCCHWGIYDYRDNSLWIGPTAFASPTRLRYVVLHELGHAFQWTSGHKDQMAADMAPWGVSGEQALEYSADCIATVEGAQMDNYWACPPAARAIVEKRLSGDWS